MVRIAVALPLVAAAAVSAQTVNTTYATGLLSTLQTAGLTSFASLASSMASSPTGQSLLARIAQGSNTLLVPSNAALANLNAAVAQNTSYLSALFEYHVLSGAFGLDNFTTDQTLTRTFLNDSNYVHLQGGAAQVLVLAYDNSTLRVRNQPAPIGVSGTANYANLTIHTLDTLLTIPGDLATLLSSYSCNTLKNSITNTTIYPSLTAAHGLTVFAPVDSAFTKASSMLSGVSSATLQTVLANHVINGTTAYSSLLGEGKYTSSAGQPFTISTNGTGTFVTSGSSTAKILLSNIVMNNGVIHVIDTVLNNQQSNTAAAQSAYSSYTASAATAVQETAAIGQTGAASSPTSNSASSSSPTSAMTLRLDLVALIGSVLAGSILLI